VVPLNADAPATSQPPDELQQFDAVYGRYVVAIFRYFSARVEPVLAEDLCAETFTEALRSRDRYRAERPSVLPWLYGIAGNVLRRHQRAERQLDAARRRLASREVEHDAVDDDAVRAADGVAGARRLLDAVEALPDHEREIVLLFAWDGLGYQEIADALGLPLGTVQSRLGRARDRLRVALKGEGR
jgi:RNA polymerase sigma factor (sigma-70 family)